MNRPTIGVFNRLSVIVIIPLMVCGLALLASRPFEPSAHSQALAAAPAQATATASPTPCPTDPPTGNRVKIRSDDDIMIVARHHHDDQILRKYVADYNGGLSVTSSTAYSTISALTDVRYLAIAAADLNGDGTAEQVLAFRDKSERLGAISSASGTTGTSWYRDGDRYKGDNLRWVDIAAGDLDRSGHDDEVAIAFEDDYNAIHVVLLNGAADGTIANAVNQDYGNWTDNGGYSTGLNDVGNVTVAVGDLNGDGYKDEIVTVMSDGNKHLHVVILRRNDDGTMTALYNQYWTSHDRDCVACYSAGSYGNWSPIDVTTGDVDGDWRDEAILGFRNDDRFQLLTLKFVQEIHGTTHADDRLVMDDSVFINATLGNHEPRAAMSVSLSAGDLDGDGVDEIAVGLGTMHWEKSSSASEAWQPVLQTFSYIPVEDPDWQTNCPAHSEGDPPCLYRLATYTGFGSKQVPAFTNDEDIGVYCEVATGELDDDGRDEIVLIRRHPYDDGDLKFYMFDAEIGLSDAVTYAVIGDGGHEFQDFGLAMGDTDGNSRYATYHGVCYSKPEMNIVSVIHAPPHGPDEEWGRNYEDAKAISGWEKGQGQGDAVGTEMMIGGSVTIGAEVHGVGPSFTSEWEKSCFVESQETTSHSDGGSYWTRAPWEVNEEDPDDEASFANLNLVKTDFGCYRYTEPAWGNMDVCVPVSAANTAHTLKWWYTDALTEYASSWVPVGINLAEGLGASASQTSNYGPAVASRAVDGNTDGNYGHNSVSMTNRSGGPRWQVDLGGIQQIDAVQLWNRTDCCGDRLRDFYVFVSEEPIPDGWPSDLISAGVWNYHVTADQGGKLTMIVPVGQLGRYVRVQLAGVDYLQLAEVQVWGWPGEPGMWPRGVPANVDDKTFKLTWPGGRVQNVPGQIVHVYNGNPQLVDAAMSGQGPGLGVGHEGETITGGSTSHKSSLGMEIKGSGVEGTTGSTQKTSHILEWSEELKFDTEIAGPSKTLNKPEYTFAPFLWLQKATSSGGVDQSFLVLDYWVPYYEATSAAAAPQPNAPAGPAVAPRLPVLLSSTHPDEAMWYTTNTAAFTWNQPAGDPATIAGYNWRLDGTPGAVPGKRIAGLTNQATFKDLGDGIWHMHVRAASDSGEWSDAVHRVIRVDTHPPQVQLTVAPGWPTGNNGWYITPLTVTVAATDTFGSGVTSVEVSTDGVAWQRYVDPLTFGADTAGTTVYARATDAVGHISEPVSTTFKIDRTAPDSHVTGGPGPGVWIAEVDHQRRGEPGASDGRLHRRRRLGPRWHGSGV